MAHGLNNILLISDSPEDLLESAISIFDFLAKSRARHASFRILASYHKEADLWDSSVGTAWHRRGLLSGSLKAEERFIFVQDIATLDVSVQRVMLSLLDLSLDPLQGEICPDLFWAVGCSRRSLKSVPSHMLDRFSVVLVVPELSLKARARLSREQYPLLAFGEGERVNQSIEQNEKIVPHVPDGILELVSSAEGPEMAGIRRYSSLLRLARGLACLDGRSVVSQSDCIEAAATLGMSMRSKEEVPAKVEESLRVSEISNEGIRVEAGTETEDILATTSPRVTGASSYVQVQEDPQVHVGVELSLESLDVASLHMYDYLESGRGLGPVIGERTVKSAHEVAVVPTVLKAARFRRIRQALSQEQGGESIQVTHADFRGWQRAGITDSLLVLLVDLTSLRGKCENAIRPHLRWASRQRAEICIVVVGARGAESEFRAEMIHVRSVIDERWRWFLMQSAGRSSPLAHGMSLVLGAVKDALSQRWAVKNIRLVVLTDGRGNVPLAASLTGESPRNVGSLGVTDALNLAVELRKVRRLRSFVLNPQPRIRRELVDALCVALGARMEIVPLW